MTRFIRALPLLLALAVAAAGAPAAQDVEAMIVADTVVVTLTDFAIDMPDTLQAGPHVFHIVNSGAARHGFEIERDDEDYELEDPVEPGATVRMDATLAPGLYRAYCPVGDHAEARGMERAFVVTARL